MIEAHSLRAKLLTSMRRYDEARQACHPEIFGENIPPDLRCAAAVVDADRGDLQAAINRLQGLVKDEPNYFMAWNLLADWYRMTEAHAEYLEAARQMVRLVPHQSLPLGYLADAQLLNHNRAGAIESLRYAMTLDPAYEFASATLFDLQIEDYDLHGAEETLNILRQHVGGEATTLRQLKLFGKREDFEKARECFRALCLSNHSNPAFISQGIEADMKTDWNVMVDEVLNEVFELPAANPYAGAVLVERQTLRKKWDECARRLSNMSRRDEFWQRATIAFLDALANEKEKYRLRQFIAGNRHDLWQNLQTWGNVGYTLFSIGDAEQSISWLSDWPNRDRPEPWMLWNLSLALCEKNREPESYHTSTHALTLPADDLSQSHNLLASFHELLRGDSAMADERLQKVNEPTLREWDRKFWRIIDALLEFHRSRENGHTAHSETVDRLIQLAGEKDFFGGSELLVKFHRRATLSVAKAQGDGLFLAWTYGRLSWRSFVRSLRG
jgi:tetratricopeptide (TPR) repeat protein